MYNVYETVNLLVELEKKLVENNISYSIDYNGNVVDPSKIYDPYSFIKFPNDRAPQYEIYQGYYLDRKELRVYYMPERLLVIEPSTDNNPTKLSYLSINEIVGLLKEVKEDGALAKGENNSET